MTAATTATANNNGGGAAPLRDEIRKAMSSVGVSLTPDLLSKCLALATTLRVAPAAMAESWEAHSLNRDVTDLTPDTFEGFRAALRRDADKNNSAPAATEGVVTSNAALGKRRAAGADAGEDTGAARNVVTPVRTPSSSSPARRRDQASAVDAVAVSPTSSPAAKKARTATAVVVPPAGPKYGERTGVGKVVASYNPQNLPEYDPAASAAAGSSGSRRRCEVSLPPEYASAHATEPYRYMFSPPEERADALDDRLVEMGEVLVERFGIRASADDDDEEETIAPLEAVGRPRQNRVCCVGRICNEAHSGRLNRTSLVLEGSRHHSLGKRVPLDVSPLTSGGASYSLFPGQIVAVEGVNSSGFKMVAGRICEGAAPSPPPALPASRLLEYHHGATYQDGKPLRIVSACGPYTTSDNLDYEPLQDLLATVRTERPDVVVLMGPFVDARQPIVARGDVSLGLEGEGSEGGSGSGRMHVTNETLFVEKVARTLEELYEGAALEEDGAELRTQFVLVPSLDDANAEFVYPQPPLADRLPNGGRELNLPSAEGITYGSLGLQHVETAGLEEGAPTTAGRKSTDAAAKAKSKRIHCVPNPCTLRINDLTIGLTSTDVLLHMSQDEANANLEPGSRMSRLAQHLVQQRSYYPLFPPPAPSSAAAGATTAPNLDLAHAEGWSMPVQPDVLLVPSKLAAFARPVLDRTVAINPGAISRGTTGGTYAVLDVHPARRETLEGMADAGVGENGGESGAGSDEQQQRQGAQDRIRVEVKRI